MEKLMYEQMIEYLDSNELISEFQSGFRRHHSCETALLKVTSDIRNQIDRGNLVLLCLLDLSKAFDSVSHSHLLSKMCSVYEFSPSAISLVQNFLSNRTQCVKAKGEVSSFKVISRGVPQGSLLGPLFFSLFINDLPSCVNFSKVHLYADDVQLYRAGTLAFINDLITEINADLASIANWSVDNGLVLNPDKSQCILFSNSSIPEQILPKVTLSDKTLCFVDTGRNLGVSLNSRMSCCAYVSDVLRKVYSGLRCLKLTARCLSTDIRLRLVRSLIVPHFLYGSIVFPSLDSFCARRISVAFNDCIRFVYLLPRSAHISEFETSILGCTLNEYLKYRSLLFLQRLSTPTDRHTCKNSFCL